METLHPANFAKGRAPNNNESYKLMLTNIHGVAEKAARATKWNKIE